MIAGLAESTPVPWWLICARGRRTSPTHGAEPVRCHLTRLH
jgi:hypothetical protein